MAFCDYIHCDACAECKPEDRGTGYKMLYVGDNDGLPDDALLLCGKHKAEAAAKVDALTRTVAALREALIGAQRFIDNCIPEGDFPAWGSELLVVARTIASPDVTIPADAWVSRAEHDRVVAERNSLDESVTGMGDLLDVRDSDARRMERDLRERDQTIAMLREQRAIDAEIIGKLNARCVDLETPRSEVRAFALLMEKTLKANDHKPGWKGDLAEQLLVRLTEEVGELGAIFQQRMRERGMRSADEGSWFMDLSAEAVGREAADVANFAMMIADVCGALVKP